MVHSVKKSLAEHGEKLEAGEKEKIEAALKEAEESLKGEDKAAIEAKTEALMAASQKLGEKVYADAQAAQAAAGAAAGARRRAGVSAKPADDNVVDADFKEVKEVICRYPGWPMAAVISRRVRRDRPCLHVNAAVLRLLH